jgi:hypothetical protein
VLTEFTGAKLIPSCQIYHQTTLKDGISALKYIYFRLGVAQTGNRAQSGQIFKCIEMVHFKIISGPTNSHDSILKVRISISELVALVRCRSLD